MLRGLAPDTLCLHPTTPRWMLQTTQPQAGAEAQPPSGGGASLGCDWCAGWMTPHLRPPRHPGLPLTS